MPSAFAPFILTFAPLFSKRVWQQAITLLVGAILVRGQRTVASALRTMGLSNERHFQNYHRVLSRAVWSTLHAARLLLLAIVAAFVPSGVIVLGIDDTIERRRGAKIKAKGLYRDAVRSSRSCVVKTHGLRWVSLMLLAPIQWAGRVWALPFLTVLAPSERYSQRYRRRHKKVTEWARQMLLQVRRWLPNRTLVVVADGGFAALDLLARLVATSPPIICITRLRLDARLYGPPPKPKRGRVGRPRLIGPRLPALRQVLTNPRTRWSTVRFSNWYGEGPRTVLITSGTAVWYHGGMPPVAIRWVLLRDPKGRFRPQALLCTDRVVSPLQILQWFQMRWQVEVTFQEVRTHLGVETQRQWSDFATARTTPVLFGLFSLVSLLANRLACSGHLPVRHAAWYRKQRPTFADALASVRNRFWYAMNFSLSPPKARYKKIPSLLLHRMREALCYAS